MQEKISISIDSELLSRVDALVDNKSLNKRSKAFEFVVREYFKNISINELVILGGSDVTINPKAIEENIKKLMKFGLKNIYIIGDKDFESVREKFSGLKVNVSIINEKELLGTAGALKLASGLIHNRFFVMFINIKFDFNVEEMVKHHMQSNPVATIGVTLGRKNTIPDNIVVEGNKIVSYNKTQNQFTNAGIYVFEPSIFSSLPKKGTLDKNVFPKLAAEGQLNSYIITENWEYLG